MQLTMLTAPDCPNAPVLDERWRPSSMTGQECRWRSRTK
jgi:hypothetical protein